MSAKFKPGDYVRILPHADIIEPSSNTFFNREMIEHLNQCFYVENERRGNNYTLCGCVGSSGYQWRWNENWLELTSDKEYKKISENEIENLLQ